MGKKSKKHKEKKAEREQHNNFFPAGYTVENLPLNPNSRTTLPPGVCMHGDVILPQGRTCTERDKRNWLAKASAIAKFGQRYSYYSTLAAPNEISYLFLKGQTMKNPSLIDGNFVKTAYASAATEILKGGEIGVELSRFKTELATIAAYWVEEGPKAFDPLIDGGLFASPGWFKEMEEKLEMIRQGEHSHIIYLANQLPCRCLEDRAKKAKQQLEEEEGGGNAAQNTCKHGKPTSMSQEWLKEMERTTVRFAFLGKSSPRDFEEVVTFLELNPTLVNNEFVKFAYASAVDMIVGARKYQFAERMCNLALMVEAHLEHGTEKVKADLKRTEEMNEMEPYLYDLYANMRKTCDMSRIVKLLSQKIPCDCLDDIRGIMHAEGKDRNECCDNCHTVCPKSQLLHCSGCRVEMYCSQECQKADYKSHKQMCRRLASALEMIELSNEGNDE